MKAESGFLEKASGALALPGEAAGLPAVHITGCREVRVERHQGLLSFSDSVIELGCGQVALKIRGRGLAIAGMCRGEIRVRGRLDAVEFIYPEGKDAKMG